MKRTLPPSREQEDALRSLCVKLDDVLGSTAFAMFVLFAQQVRSSGGVASQRTFKHLLSNDTRFGIEEAHSECRFDQRGSKLSMAEHKWIND